jgi:hypothetical protein
MEHSPETNPPVSIWPIILAFGLGLMVTGVVTSLIVSIFGVIMLLVSLAGWSQESRIFALQSGEAEEEEEGSHE